MDARSLAVVKSPIRFAGELELIERSPNGRFLALVWKSDGNIKPAEQQRFLQLADAQSLRPLMQPKKIGGKNRAGSLSFSADGKYLVVGIDYGFQLWDTEAKKEISRSDGRSSIWQSQFHPVRREIITIGGTKDIQRWQIADLSSAETINSGLDQVRRIRFRPVGDSLLVFGKRAGKNVLELQSYPDFKVMVKYPAELDPKLITELRFSPDGERFVFRRPGGVLGVGKVNEGRFQPEINCGATVHKYRFINVNTILASVGDGQLKLIQVELPSISNFLNLDLASSQFEVLQSPPRLVAATKLPSGISQISAWNILPIVQMRAGGVLTAQEHLEQGIRLCLEKSDWSQGLRHLIDAKHPVISPLATADASGLNPLTRLTLGSKWQQLAEGSAEPEIRKLAVAAAERSFRTVEATATGLTKLRAGALLKQLEER
ncbi:WD40 repeat domain-containing protein [Stieleria sp. JC731]|uniref:WD40 repeat domain-containing protein n=2 Tax=Pirellulaceae TaxID=2691357 RepID=UPI001E608932|nr:WD40 repeat domain-containing protein [Stieleria sp. JC731]MCC9602222.1 WD40 repeat domain-containing protein [Stieleria sp. JC731]